MASVDVTRIASNIQALNALNSLQLINAKLATHQQRLSTGKKINSAGDDPAGLTIATKMLARSEGMKASIDNISDAKNMLSVAEAGLSTMTDIMIAMRTQAEKAASDTLGNSERAVIQTQLSAYAAQIQDLVDQTKWNGVKLLDNTTGVKTFQTGVDEGEVTTWTLPNALTPGTTGLNISKKVTATTISALGSADDSFTGSVATSGTLGSLTELTTGDYSVKILGAAASVTVGAVALDPSSVLSAGIDSLTASTTSTSTALTSGTYTLKILDAISTTTTSYQITKLGDTSFGTNGTLTVTNANLTGSGGNLTATSATTNWLGVKITSNDLAALTEGQLVKFEYIAKGDAKYALQDSQGQALQVATNTSGTTTGFAGYAAQTATVNTGRGIRFTLAAIANIGAGEQTSFTYEKANLYSVNVSTAAKGSEYLTTINNALDKVNSALSDLGALMSRLTYKEEQSATAQVNIEGAYNRIMNANMAEEQVNASKYTILQQTATAMLAQANAAPQALLTLFR